MKQEASVSSLIIHRSSFIVPLNEGSAVVDFLVRMADQLLQIPAILFAGCQRQASTGRLFHALHSSAQVAQVVPHLRPIDLIARQAANPSGGTIQLLADLPAQTLQIGYHSADKLALSLGHTAVVRILEVEGFDARERPVAVFQIIELNELQLEH